MSSGTSRQITIGTAQIPLSEATKLVTLQVTIAGGVTIPARIITVTGGSNTVTTASTADLYVGLKISPVATYFLNGTTITSIVNATTFTVADTVSIATSQISTALSARSMTVTAGSNIVTGTTTSDLVVGMFINQPTYFVAGTTVASVTNATTFVASTNALLSSAIASFYAVASTTRVFTGGSNIVTGSSTNGIVVGMSVNNSIYFAAGTTVTGITNATTFTTSTSALVPTNVGGYFYQTLPKSISVTSGSNVVTVISGNTSDILVGMVVAATAGLAAGTTVVSVTNATTFVASTNATATTSTNAFSTASRTIYSVAGSNIITTATSTADLYVGLLLQSSFFADGTTVTGITNATTFTVSTFAIGTGSSTAFSSKYYAGISNGGSNIVTFTTGTTADIIVGKQVPFASSIFAIGTTVVSITNATTFVVSTNAIGQAASGACFVTPNRVISGANGSNIYTTTSTADLYVGQAFACSLFSIATSIVSITNATTFVASSNLVTDPVVTTGLTVASRVIAAPGGNNICTVASTADLVAGLLVNSTNFIAGTTIVSITNATTFVASTNAVITATGSATFNSDDYMMFTSLSSGNIYQVPSGKTFMIVAYYPNSTAPILFGYASAALVTDAGGRLRSHVVPTGAVHYATNSTDYTYNANLPSTSITFPSLMYPFVKTATASFYPILVGVEF